MIEKNTKTIKSILFTLFTFILIGYGIVGIFLYVQNKPHYQKAMIGNTEIGTDSIVAIDNLSKRLKLISREEYCDCLFTTSNEGYGYDFNGEMFRMKFDEQKVIEITYQNCNIDTISIDINGDDFVFNKRESFTKESENFIVSYNGKNKFNIKKK